MKVSLLISFSSLSLNTTLQSPPPLVPSKTGDKVSPDQINEEIKFLTGLKLTETNEDPLGSAVYHSLSTAGVLYCERNDLAD